MKVSEFEGIALLWAVCRAEGYDVVIETAEQRMAAATDLNRQALQDLYQGEPPRVAFRTSYGSSSSSMTLMNATGFGVPDFLNNHMQAGRIIEREGIALRRIDGVWYAMMSSYLGDQHAAGWKTFYPGSDKQIRFHDQSMLVAAMRCWVAYKLGQDIQLPKELV